MFLDVRILCVLIHLTQGLPFHQGCQHSGVLHQDGSEVPMADPCVKCRCVRGVLVCRLRVCAPQPHPPPPGCLVLTRRAECCQRLVCSQEEPVESNRRRLADDVFDETSTSNGCMVNGSLYAEGSAMDSSTHCQYCYCIKGQQHCVRPQCLLSQPDCVPTYTPNSCCPAKYNCSTAHVHPTTTTSKPESGCLVDDRVYPEGELIPRHGADCETCYCLQGHLHCEPVICSVPVNRHCVPILTPGHCCPTSYNCTSALRKYKLQGTIIIASCSSGSYTYSQSNDELSFEQTKEPSDPQDLETSNTQAVSINQMYVNSERSITGSSINSSDDKDIILQTTQPTTEPPTYETTTFDRTTAIIEDLTTILEEINEITETTTEFPSTTEVDITTLPSTTLVTDMTEVEERHQSRVQEELTSTSKLEDDITTLVVSSTSPSSTTEKNKVLSTTNSPNKSLPADIEAIVNKTKVVKEEEYDDYYDEATLPPSLPNLRIIPFVAADAVVDDDQEPMFTPTIEKSHVAEDPHFYDVSHTSGFSPPAETEGGFVPKEPVIDGPFYESKYHTTRHSGILPLEITISPLPAITEPSNTHEAEKCVSGGQSYRHGELLSEPSACDLCICLYGNIHCQEPKCPVPEPGCHLLHERDYNSCCQKMVCSSNNVESPTRVVELVTPAPHLPPFTVADVIVTPDPFRDVIRTEPAPDLSSLIGEIVPYLWDQTTKNPLTTTTEHFESGGVPATTPSTAPKTTTRPTSEFTSSTTASTTTANLTTLLYKNENVTNPSDQYNDKEIKEEDTSDDEISFDSVFSYLFDSEKWTTTTSTTEKLVLKTKKPSQPTKNTINQFPNRKITNKPNGVLFNSSKPDLDRLEHRSDEDVNYLSNLLNSTSETEKLQTSTDNKVSLEEIKTTTRPKPIITLKSPDKIVHSTTVRNKISTKRFGLKNPSTYSRPFFTKPTPATTISVADPGAASGLLKLAGCNIYGRMYRVGRIITELSGPCLECMCTEVGVQCRPLKC